MATNPGWSMRLVRPERTSRLRPARNLLSELPKALSAEEGDREMSDERERLDLASILVGSILRCKVGDDADVEVKDGIVIVSDRETGADCADPPGEESVA